MAEEWTVSCVLRSGGDFRAEHVQSLKRQVERHFQNPHRFLCLSDTYVPRVDYRLCREYWPGWWGKLELFWLQAELGGPMLFIDLDTVLVHDFSLPDPGAAEFWMIRDFLAWGKEEYKSRWWASGLMAWNQDFSAVFDRAVQEGMDRVARFYSWDQIFIGKALSDIGGIEMRALNDVLDLASYKVHNLQSSSQAPDSQIVCFHGTPRPWDVTTPWVVEARR